MIRTEFLRAQLGLARPHQHLKHGQKDDHIPHCFEYLRQGLMCAADTALERAVVEEGNIVRDVDGWGVEHECRDWNAIYEWANENRSYDDQVIIDPSMALQPYEYHLKPGSISRGGRK